ncbi:MAG: glycosyltransferase [Leptospirales bacterium]|nr:glycosyltransferase [Leptospirales bacterium]
MKSLVIIPAYNEEQTIYEVVTRTLKHSDVSVTNDGSRDRTPEILRTIQQECADKKHPFNLNVVTHEKSTHIPQGLQDGFKYGVSKGYETFITMDAGMSHDPDAVPTFLSADPSLDVVIGMRAKVQNVPWYRKIISRLAALVVNYALTPSYFSLGPGLTDCTSGFRRYSRRAAVLIAGANLKSRAFDFHMEALAMCVREGMKAGEIPITYVFSNSSFNSKVLKQAMKFGLYLVSTKGQRSSPAIQGSA